MNKLDLLAKGWKPSEVEHAKRIVDQAEDNKDQKTKVIDGMLLGVFIILILINGFVCSTLLAPFIFVLNIKTTLVVTALIGIIFSTLFTVIIRDIERIHHKHETNLFVAMVATGVINFYFILQFTAQFSARTKLPIMHNVYVIAGTYAVAFLLPHIIYQITKKSEI